MYIKNKKDPKINPCGIPVQISAQDKPDHLKQLFAFCHLKRPLKYY